MTAIRILLIDDHEIVREGLITLLSEEADMVVVGQAANGKQGVRMAQDLQPDVILLDLLMPEMDGLQTLHELRAARIPSRVIVLTSYTDDQHVQPAISAGAIGYLHKNVLKAELLHAIRVAAQGKPALDSAAQDALMRQARGDSTPPASASLTVRELEVLKLVAKGMSNKEIAVALSLTEGTVKGYVSAVLAKIGVADRTQAALYAVKHKLVPGT